MKYLIFIAFFVIAPMTNAQTNFEKGMSKAFELWSANKTDEAENMFERIAKAEPEAWLSHYYIAQINSIKSWTEKDKTVLKSQLDKAQEHIDAAMLLSENNAELLVIQAHILTNWVAFDGMTYGMKYGAKIAELYEKAAVIDPTNPRAAYGKIEWEMGSAKYFGKDTAPYCKKLASAIALFDTFKPASKLHPNWGKDRAVQVLESCK